MWHVSVDPSSCAAAQLLINTCTPTLLGGGGGRGGGVTYVFIFMINSVCLDDLCVHV